MGLQKNWLIFRMANKELKSLTKYLPTSSMAIGICLERLSWTTEISPGCNVPLY